jgi:hypothetical protein
MTLGIRVIFCTASRTDNRKVESEFVRGLSQTWRHAVGIGEPDGPVLNECSRQGFGLEEGECMGVLQSCCGADQRPRVDNGEYVGIGIGQPLGQESSAFGGQAIDESREPTPELEAPGSSAKQRPRQPIRTPIGERRGLSTSDGAVADATRMARCSSMRITAEIRSAGEIRLAGADLLQRSLQGAICGDPVEVGRILSAEGRAPLPADGRRRLRQTLEPCPELMIHAVILPVSVVCHILDSTVLVPYPPPE